MQEDLETSVRVTRLGSKDSGELWCATFSAAFSFVSSAIFWASMISASGKKPASVGAKHNAATSTLSCRMRTLFNLPG